MQEFIIDQQSDGKHLVRVILARFPALSPGQVHQALRRKDVRQNGLRCKTDGPVSAGDRIAVYLPDDVLYGNRPASRQSPEIPPYLIVYEDPMILIINKAPGITVHQAGDSHEQGPFLIDLLRSDLQDDNLTLCHRLDRQTGGLLIVARRAAALEAVRELMQKNLLVKRYRCLVRGVPVQGDPVKTSDGKSFIEVTAWLEKDARHSDVYIHDLKQPGDLPIITRYRVLRVISPDTPEQEDTAELEVELVTGRTHQIRAHMAHLGHPLLGDGKYGRNSYNKLFCGSGGPLRRQQLYATELRFSQQITGPLACLAGKVIAIDPEFEWPKAPCGRMKGTFGA